MKERINKLLRTSRDSSFNRHSYSVSKELKNFVEGMTLHTWYEANDHQRSYKDMDINHQEWLQRITPPFQRANNKWTKKMKVKFIENLLNGAKTELLFYRFNENEDALILDGLQRTTAIVDFFAGKVKPFGFTHKQLEEHLRAFQTNITIKIYTFDKIEEVGKFYIDMNENITHSKADIQKAKDWFLEEKGIEL